jgi:hypothetical protein
MQDKSFLIKICCLMGAILVALAVIAVIVARPGEDATMDSGNTTQSSTNTSEDTTEDTTNTTEDTTETTEETTETTETTEETEQKYNPTFDIEDNVFLDALAYTGYNIEKHRADGLMWEYVLAAEKRGKGWLSPITYGGGSTGLETTEEGLPDLKKFQRGGLVCASFASYVYFNYLPNVAGIDTSSLKIPDRTPSAQSFYLAAQQWLKEGYTRNIAFTAENRGGGIKFMPEEEIPIGSIIAFHDMNQPGKTTADHITVYVGYKNGYHWVIQTGNKNGPEFCAVERFKFGPDPMWPLAIFTTPTCITNPQT